ncbi:MAG: transcriptional repressor AgaR [Pyrinomonadaceae bacterium]
MLTEERRGAIVDLLNENGKVRVKDLSKTFKTSEVTIRTDLKELHRRGLAFKSHGGAVLPTNLTREPSLSEKFDKQLAEKARIGVAAAEFISNGETIILDSGSTTHEVAKRIKERQELTVITNGLNIAMELAGCRGIQVILLGGVMRHGSLSIIGHFAERMLEQLTADKLFLAADGCTLEFGISTPKFEESQINQAMVKISHERYLIADSSKFGKNSLSRISSLWEMNTVITDDALPDDYREEMMTRGMNLVLV